MKIYLFSYIRLNEEEQSDLNLYRHFLDYYINLGIIPKNIFILPYGDKNYKNNFEEFQQINESKRVPNQKLITECYNYVKSHDEYVNWCKNINRSDWVIKCEMDEFYDYGQFCTVREAATFLQKNKYVGLRGKMIDCLADDHTLPEVSYPEDLFNQFPKTVRLTELIIRSNINKVMLNKAYVELMIGHHEFEYTNWKKTEDTMVYTTTWSKKKIVCHEQPTYIAYHFKWIKNLTQRVKLNKKRNLTGQSDFNEDNLTVSDFLEKDKINLIIC